MRELGNWLEGHDPRGRHAETDEPGCHEGNSNLISVTGNAAVAVSFRTGSQSTSSAQVYKCILYT